MSQTVIYWNFDIGGIPTNPTSVVFSDPTGTFGVRRADTLAVVVPDGTPLVNTGVVGQYSYTFTDPAYSLTYNYWIEFVYLGNTFRVEQDISGTTPPTPSPAPSGVGSGAVTSGCGGRYAEAWQFAAFWCVSSIIRNIDNSGIDGKLFLQDSVINFETEGVVADKGMILYNLSDGSSGPVTAVTANTLTANLSGGTDNLWDDDDEYRIVPITAREIATIQHYLDIAASDIHAALAAQGMCSCTFASWAAGYLQKLNVIDAAAYYRCPCASPQLTDEARQNYLEWMSAQLELIRTGKIELCAGATGAEFPVVDWAEQSSTEFAAARIIFNDQLRNGY